ncbi:MAG: ABC transporter ATP-binding protein [Candidatus Odinarchaeota archaeon]|nr:ABC transporter ATP-binding protein [Candidatus Odinarchaeota archaeon]
MNSFRFVLRYVVKHKKYLTISLMSMLIYVMLNLMIPLILREIIDNAIINANIQYLLYLSLAVVGIAVAGSAFSYARRYFLQLLAQQVIYDVRNDLYGHVLQLSFSFFDKKETGQIMSRITQDVENLRRLVAMGIVMLLSAIITIISSVFVMFTLNVELTLITLLVFPFMILGSLKFGRTIRPKFYIAQKRLGSLTSVVQQNIVGIRVVKAFSQEEKEIEKFRKKNKEYFDITVETAKIRAKYIPALVALVGINALVIFWYGGNLVIKGLLTLGTLIAFYSYLIQLAFPVRFLGFFFVFFQNALASADRIVEIINAKGAIEKDGNIELKDLKGHIVFDHVYFKYEDRYILEDMSFEINPGEKVAIVGTTGSGKSTIIRLIPRFYDVTKGRILIDGYDVRDLKLSSLREKIGLVPQETFLFGGTILQNLTFGNPNAKMEEIIRAAKLANIHDFIMSLPKGYYTRIGERGITLSGGQKQRLAIARALLKDPKIIIMDDSTASVDLKTEREIQKALDTALKGRTAILITQRIPTIRRSDKIIVIDNKRVVGVGTHDELYETNEVYRKIYDAQLKQYRESIKKSAETKKRPQRGLKQPENRNIIKEERH